jgi:beta-glucosidase
MIEFPEEFVWGAGTSAFQVEGSLAADGRRPSIWDTFTAVPGAVVDGDTGAEACDHYRLLVEDVALMRDLGLRAYRFSVAWPRVRPDAGPVNPAGLDFYERLVDALLEAGITPWPTLYHWDLPQSLEDAGGWPVRDTAFRFAEYAASVAERLTDRVDTWTTLNEPWCSAFLGYTGGQHAPGRQEGPAGLRAAHHLLLGHGLATQALRAAGAREVGIVLNTTRVSAHDPHDPADLDAAERIDALRNGVFMDPLFRSEYPARILRRGDWTEVVRGGDLALISQPLDLLGVNYYHDEVVSARPVGEPVRPVAAPRPTRSPYPDCDDVHFPSRGLPVTGMNWEINPDGLRQMLVEMDAAYSLPPIYITENGAAFDDDDRHPGPDPERMDYLAAHVAAVGAARDAGVDVRGYFAWSLLDNFEWALGYGQRFGLVHVDFDTQVRTPRDSARWYADVCRTGRPEIPVASSP